VGINPKRSWLSYESAHRLRQNGSPSAGCNLPMVKGMDRDHGGQVGPS
jgi:hypothetical protein